MTVFCCRSLQTSVVLKQKKKRNIQVPFALTYPVNHNRSFQRARWRRVTGPALTSATPLWLASSLGQLLDDDSGHRVPASGRVTTGVVCAGPHPHGHVHQSRFHALAQAFHCKGGRRQRRLGKRQRHIALPRHGTGGTDEQPGLRLNHSSLTTAWGTGGSTGELPGSEWER